MYESYVKMKPNDLHDHLTHTLKLHPFRIEQIKKDVATLKETQRTDRITRTVRKQAWQDLLQPLQAELSNAKVGRKYKTGHGDPNPERLEAFDAYIKVMEKLLAKFSMPSTKLTLHPSQMVKEHNDTSKGSPIPNNGVHWTDWVPSHIKIAIADAFAALPRKPKAKRKIPFQRVTLPAQHKRAKAKLIKRTHTELATAERLYQLNPTEENGQLITRIDKALKVIENLQPNEVVPPTWHGTESF